MIRNSQPILCSITDPTCHGWEPQTIVAHNKFVKTLLGAAAQDQIDDPNDPVNQFFDALTPDQINLLENALQQVNMYHALQRTNRASAVTDLDELKKVLRSIVKGAPRFYKHSITIGEPVGTPMYLVFDLIGNTSPAYTLFTQETFNKAMCNLLSSWGHFLATPESSATLNESHEGWFGPAALQILEAGLGQLKFDQTFETELPSPRRYRSWDSFFTRKLRHGVRPIASPRQDTDFFYLYHPCESTVLRTATNVQLYDTFWAKTQNYSLYDIFGKPGEHSLIKAYAERLVGASAYQGYLGPADYHRWHSPFNGVVAEEPLVIPGTYFAVLPDDRALDSNSTPLVQGDPRNAMLRCQPWLSAVATRAVFIIKPDDPPCCTNGTTSTGVLDAPFELAALVMIGMGEVSSCEPTVHKGARVSVGDELGVFHFGGSSHVLFVKPKHGYRVDFKDDHNRPVRPGQHRWVNSVIGQISASRKARD